jgi:hypothetical protein
MSLAIKKACWKLDTLHEKDQIVIKEVRKKIVGYSVLSVGIGYSVGHIWNKIAIIGTNKKIWNIPQANKTTGIVLGVFCSLIFGYPCTIMAGANQLKAVEHIYQKDSLEDLEYQYELHLQKEKQRRKEERKQQRKLEKQQQIQLQKKATRSSRTR